MITPNMHVVVQCKDHEGNALLYAGDTLISYEETTIVEKDKFKKLIGDGNARVSTSVSARMGGPYGFSGISVNTTLTLTCNQDDKTIQKAKEMSYAECLSMLDETMGPTMVLLNAQLAEHYREE